MKCVQLICVLSVLCAVSARSVPKARPARNGMFFYQSAPSYYKPGTQRAMYVQYGTPYRPTNRRSTEEGGVAAFAAGDTVAAGTFLKDCKPAEGDIEQPVEPQPAVVQFDDENVQALAEAEPEQIPLAQGADSPFVEQEEAHVNEVIPLPQEEPQQHEVDAPEVAPEEFIPATRFGDSDNGAKTPKELGFPVEAPADEPLFVHAVAAAPEPTPPATKKHVRIELETEDDEDEFVPFNQKTSGRNGQSGNAPPSSFFPVNFGSTHGGAIAIANSFSTGKGGHATSHATAYGAPGQKSSNRRA